jgi:hypothetical protein
LRRHGPLLIYVIEAEDIERGAQAFATSTHKIDAETQGRDARVPGGAVAARAAV